MSEILAYKCPCCGGKIEFNSTLQKLQCPYCDTVFDPETLRDYDDILKKEKPDEMEWSTEPSAEWSEADGMSLYVCNSCGGEIVTDPTTAATHCPYCGNPVMLTGRLAGGLKPDLVIPFQLDKKAAVAGLSQHLTGKRLLPKVFKDQNHIEEVKALYAPYWLFDSDADASIRYRGTKVRTWSDSQYRYTETSYFAVARDGSLSFQNVPVDGSKKLADDLMESIEPYDMSRAVDFQTAYLSGYLADRYDVSSEESIARANDRIKSSTEREFASTVVGYSTLTTDNSSVQFRSNRIRYALLPVWLLSTKWKDQNFLFAMNGQTGKFVGDLPLDKGAYWRWFFGLFLPISAAIFGLISLFMR